MNRRKEIEELNKGFARIAPEELLGWALDFFGSDKISLSSSLGAEDQVLTDMILKINPKARIFTIDTGRLPQETYDTITATMAKYSIKYDILFPDQAQVETMERENGPNFFLESIEKRKLCCEIRKIRPLRKYLSKVDAWICGLRREQSITRTGIDNIEWDANFGLAKLNPLADWSESDVWNYIRKNNVPYNKLHDLGYPSIGCSPCTRAVKLGEHPRAGRWWWEEADKKECGLHVAGGKLIRENN
ncbi:MAG TPA: phosphoadenylyl-sulfate reductase [Lentisphaeria bacterium]|nr:MAG: phosphoadenosine phosphosulfate reductase [Lentisphaerae bacterium GWF2_49_21]HBC86972.1 phosphoadenylyl-sulfate reductase [Lentisphaeria bacterium]